MAIKPTAKLKKKTNRVLPARKNLQLFDKLAPDAPQVRVGYPATELDGVRYPKTGERVIDVAFWNEFGTKRIPERSFLRKTLIINRQKYRRDLQMIAKKAINGGDLTELTRRLGLVAVADVQNMITAVKEPPNAPATIDHKKSENPLINIGFMRSSTTFELRTGKNGKTKKE